MKLCSLWKSASPPVDCRKSLAAKACQPSVLAIRDFYQCLQGRQLLSLFSQNQTTITINPDNPCQVLTISASANRGLFVHCGGGIGQNGWTGTDELNVLIA